MNRVLNDTILALVQDLGIKAVLEAVAVACDREEAFAADSDEPATRSDLWHDNAEAVRSILDKVEDEDK